MDPAIRRLAAEPLGLAESSALRGSTIVSDGTLNVGPNHGRWQPRRIDPEIDEGPAVI